MIDLFILKMQQKILTAATNTDTQSLIAYIPLMDMFRKLERISVP